MRRPMIGVTSSKDNENRRIFIHHAYMEMLEKAGAMPVLLPITDDEAMIELLDLYDGYELYCFFDRDKSGDKLRKVMKRTFSEATHLHVPSPFIEVANTPPHILKDILKKNHFAV